VRHLTEGEAMIKATVSPAPDFRGEPHPYPSQGPRLSVAWQAVWDELHAADDDGLGGEDLIDLMTLASEPPITRDTALNLLGEACAAGWLYAHRSNRRLTRARATYRLTYAARLVSAGHLEPETASECPAERPGGPTMPGDPVAALSASRVSQR
jgi:hypothetical protein